jgi:hypothetical protein
MEIIVFFELRVFQRSKVMNSFKSITLVIMLSIVGCSGGDDTADDSTAGIDGSIQVDQEGSDSTSLEAEMDEAKSAAEDAANAAAADAEAAKRQMEENAAAEAAKQQMEENADAEGRNIREVVEEVIETGKDIVEENKDLLEKKDIKLPNKPKLP